MLNRQVYDSGAVVYDIPYFQDSRGALNVLEISRELPFECRRIFYTYPVPIHRQQAYREDFSGVVLPVAERLAGRILSVSVYPELTDDEVSYVIDAVKGFFRKK